MKHSLPALAAVAAALLAPAVAHAHPQVYETTAKVVAPGSPSPPTEADLVDQTRYAIGNDGFTAVLRESNGRLGDGLVNYLLMPAGSNSYRATLTPEQKLERDTNVQAHATCDVPALTTDEAIISWQAGEVEAGTDPFYAYVPFQAGTGGFGDKPERWIALVEERTGVDLATVADPAAACTGLGGTYYAADAVQSSSAQFSSAVIAGAVKVATDPLRAQVDTLSTQVGVLMGQVAAAQAAASAADGRAQSALRPLKVAVIGAPTVRGLAASGLPVALTGPSGSAVQLRMQLSPAKAKALGLRSRVIGTGSSAVQPDGTQSLTLTPTRTAATALRRARTSLGVTVLAVAGDRTAAKTVSLKR